MSPVPHLVALFSSSVCCTAHLACKSVDQQAVQAYASELCLMLSFSSPAGMICLENPKHVICTRYGSHQLVKAWLFGAGEQGAVEAAGPSGKATSVTVLLSQALRSDDHQLLEKCFAMSNERVVKSTVQQLPPQDAARLLQVAVQRLQSSPRRGKQIATWLRALLLHHTAYLMSAPGEQGLPLTQPCLVWLTCLCCRKAVQSLLLSGCM